MPDILLLSGSPSPTSRSSSLLKTLREQFVARGFDAAYLSVRDLPAEDLIAARYDSPALQPAIGLVATARAIIVGTPVYKAAYAGTLKTFLDVLPQYALRGKIALPIATGGSPAHLLAIEYTLKPLLSILGSTDILPGIYATDDQVAFSPSGELVIDPAIQARFADALQQVTERLNRLPSSTPSAAPAND